MPGASYTPRLLMPTKRFSTRCDAIPTACLPPTAFAVVMASNAVVFMPLNATGRPSSKRTVTVSGESGASFGNTPIPGVTNHGGVSRASSLPASWVRPSRLASVLYGADFDALIGSLCPSQ